MNLYLLFWSVCAKLITAVNEIVLIALLKDMGFKSIHMAKLNDLLTQCNDPNRVRDSWWFQYLFLFLTNLQALIDILRFCAQR